MGLLNQTIEFKNAAPSIAEIQEVLGPAAEEISFSGDLDLSPEDNLRVETHTKSPKSIPFRSHGVHCTHHSESMKKKRGITYIDVDLSLDGHTIVLTGNNLRLMNSMRKALISLGGVEKPLQS